MEEYSDEYNLNGKPIKQGFKKNENTDRQQRAEKRAYRALL